MKGLRRTCLGRAASARIALCVASVVFIALAVFFRHDARASGFYLTDRGVRALSRAGAFVAGADDPHAVWYNPAGLTEARRGFLFDTAFVLWGNEYRRVVQPGPSASPIQFPSVSGSAAPFPVPTLAFTHDFGVRNATFAAALYAPYAVITSYPETITPPGATMPQPAPQRYSLISLDGSLLAVGGFWFAYRPVPRFSFGVGIQALFGSFASLITLSGCPATITCQPENPEWDALTQLRVGPIFAPTGNLGVRVTPVDWLVLGASFQLPMWVSAPAQIQVRVPSSAFFDGARTEGDRGTVNFALAPILRVGAEFRPTRLDRIEVAFVAEFWGIHDRIGLDPVYDAAQPNGIRIVNARAINAYEIGRQTIARSFQNTVSIRIGAERSQPLGNDWRLWPRVGFAFETSATAPEHTSVLTLDSDKFLLSLGIGLSRGGFHVDIVYAHVFASTVNVGPLDGRLYQIRPFRTNESPGHPVNGGLYDFAVNVVGASVRYAY